MIPSSPVPSQSTVAATHYLCLTSCHRAAAHRGLSKMQKSHHVLPLLIAKLFGRKKRFQFFSLTIADQEKRKEKKLKHCFKEDC